MGAALALAVLLLLPPPAAAHSGGLVILFFFLPLFGAAACAVAKYALVRWAFGLQIPRLALRALAVQAAELILFVACFAAGGLLYVRLVPAGGPSMLRELAVGAAICAASTGLNVPPNLWLAKDPRRALALGAVFPLLYLTLGSFVLWSEYQP